MTRYQVLCPANERRNVKKLRAIFIEAGARVSEQTFFDGAKRAVGFTGEMGEGLVAQLRQEGYSPTSDWIQITNRTAFVPCGPMPAPDRPS